MRSTKPEADRVCQLTSAHLALGPLWPTGPGLRSALPAQPLPHAPTPRIPTDSKGFATAAGRSPRCRGKITKRTQAGRKGAPARDTPTQPTTAILPYWKTPSSNGLPPTVTSPSFRSWSSASSDFPSPTSSCSPAAASSYTKAICD